MAPANDQRTLVVVGSGPGIGVSTASHFVSQGFNNVALLSRNAERLQEDADKVAKAGLPNRQVNISQYPVDVSDHVALTKILKQVESKFGAPDVVLYNAARVAESRVGEVEPDFILEDFKIINIGCYTTARWALPLLESRKKSTPDSHPSFLITGGLIFEQPSPDHVSLSMQKAAQVNLATNLRHAAGPKGVHVATIAIGGAVQDSDPVMNAKNIASKFWDLYQEDQSSWSSLIYLGGK